MKILGIDPGTHRIGYGLILRKNGLKPVAYGVIEIQEGSILIAAEQFQKLLEKLKPNLVAVEKLFFSKNRKTALSVAQTRGILMLKILENKIPLCPSTYHYPYYTHTTVYSWEYNKHRNHHDDHHNRHC